VTLRKKVEEKFDLLKNPKLYDVQTPIYNNSEVVAYLKPIQYNFQDLDYNLSELLSRWRVENPSISTGTFKVTEERTTKWLLSHVLGRKDRIIFMIYSLEDEPLGHIGLSNINYNNNSVELDSVLRGVKSFLPGLMTFSTKSMIEFAFNYFKFSDIYLSVFSDNFQAIRFYENLNFEEVDKMPLMKIEKDDEIKYEVTSKNSKIKFEKYYLKMKLVNNEY
jgi:RimJ/RimL family protein N-acetyltransferase|tara:strand:+ start:5843 stop:6502 length:660 start_codon:yes stop_codon:yes gene_type:complete